jgi:hypothetical protein
MSCLLRLDRCAVACDAGWIRSRGLLGTQVSKSVRTAAGVRGWLKSRSEDWRTLARLLQHNGRRLGPGGAINKLDGTDSDCSGGVFVHLPVLNLT